MLKPINNLVRPMATDLYQITMAYAYFENESHNNPAVFDLFIRECPFGGEFAVFAGLEQIMLFLSNFKFREHSIRYLKEGLLYTKKRLQKEFAYGLKTGYIRSQGDRYEKLNFGHWGMEYWEPVEYPINDVFVPAPLQSCAPEFFEWLGNLDCSKIKVFSLTEGTLMFPYLPIIRVEGPIATNQILETTLLTLTNFPSLITTNAARYRLAAGFDVNLLEGGLRRAQGPDGGFSASYYSYIGGFDGTSNVQAGELTGLSIGGTQAHSFITSFRKLNDLKTRTIKSPDGKCYDFVRLVLKYREKYEFTNTNEGELTALIAYAQAFPHKFMALLDTYDTLRSGLPNFICVALALLEIGYIPLGGRIDSGDLSYYSKEIRKLFVLIIDKEFPNSSNPLSKRLKIVASNEIDEEVLYSLQEQGHEINTFLIGTHVVTCSGQPALGGVYKLQEIQGDGRIKLAEGKTTIPGKKEAYRLYGKEGYPLNDLMIEVGEDPPIPGKRILCRHPFEEIKRMYVTPSKVEPLHHCVWDGKRRFTPVSPYIIRQYVISQLKNMRPDYLRKINPAPYKVSVSEKLYDKIHNIIMKETPVFELS